MKTRTFRPGGTKTVQPSKSSPSLSRTVTKSTSMKSVAEGLPRLFDLHQSDHPADRRRTGRTERVDASLFRRSSKQARLEFVRFRNNSGTKGLGHIIEISNDACLNNGSPLIRGHEVHFGCGHDLGWKCHKWILNAVYAEGSPSVTKLRQS